MPEENAKTKPVQTELALAPATPTRRAALKQSRNLVTLLAIIALLVVYVLWRNEVTKRFPQIAAGAYLGEITGLAINSKNEFLK